MSASSRCPCQPVPAPCVQQLVAACSGADWSGAGADLGLPSQIRPVLAGARGGVSRWWRAAGVVRCVRSGRRPRRRRKGSRGGAAHDGAGLVLVWLRSWGVQVRCCPDLPSSAAGSARTLLLPMSYMRGGVSVRWRGGGWLLAAWRCVAGRCRLLPVAVLGGALMAPSASCGCWCCHEARAVVRCALNNLFIGCVNAQLGESHALFRADDGDARGRHYPSWRRRQNVDFTTLCSTSEETLLPGLPGTDDGGATVRRTPS